MSPEEIEAKVKEKICEQLEVSPEQLRPEASFVDDLKADSLAVVVGLLLVRGLLSQMDVPTRSSYVMAIVLPQERPAAASITTVPRSLASAAGPVLAGYLLGLSPFGWPLVAAGAVKIAYDLLLLATFGRVRPPEEPRVG